MRVLLDTTLARRGPSGTTTYVRRLAEALRTESVEVIEAADLRRGPPAGGGAGSVANAARDRWWVEVDLPARARSVAADVIHHPHPALARNAPCAQVVTVHDLGFERLPECYDRRFRWFARRVQRAAARGAGAVVCPSLTTATDVRSRWGVEPERVVVAQHGPGEAHAGGEGERPATQPASPGHLLYVGDSEPRKNLRVLLAAYRRYRETAASPLALVLAGTATARQEGVRVEAAPDPGRLAALYRDAVLLVHPSLHEGFGLTSLEAMSAGVPVLAARAPGLVETCGGAARFFDPRDPEDLVRALERLLEDEPARRDLAERGRRRASEFSWSRSAREHIAAYTLALG